MRANPKIQTDNDNVAYKVCKTNTQTNKQTKRKQISDIVFSA
jgi:hypothetical protein